ncbi:RDD family protein [Actinoplanes sp. NPDC023936]|uniref:RDD family protein n=1 Tax=Actinoplanes sp. NPDC023936 TaxID=3154910 RepID=UPI0033D8EAFE
MNESPAPGRDTYPQGHIPAQWPAYGSQPYAAAQPYAATQPSTAAQPYTPAPQPGQYATPAITTPLVSPGGRLGAVLLDIGLVVVTLWIGWFAWSMVTWSQGQSPGKKLLGYVVVDAATGQPFDWSRMALRELGIKGLLGTVLSMCTLGVYFWADALMILGAGTRTLHDRMAASVVRHL